MLCLRMMNCNMFLSYSLLFVLPELAFPTVALVQNTTSASEGTSIITKTRFVTLTTTEISTTTPPRSDDVYSYTITVPSGISGGLAFWQSSDTLYQETLTIIGPTTLIHSVNVPTKRPPNLIFPFTSMITESGIQAFKVPHGNTTTITTITGPTTWIATLSAQWPLAPTVKKFSSWIDSFTQTVDSGSIILDVPGGPAGHLPVTVAGPTTFITTYTANEDFPYVMPGRDKADPHCSQALTTWKSLDRFLTYARLYTVLDAGQVVTEQIQQTSVQGAVYMGWKNSYSTFTGPNNVYATLTTDFWDPFAGGAPMVFIPGQVCGGACGVCQLHFPTVSVYYWPVSSPNTACPGISPNSIPQNNTKIQARTLDVTGNQTMSVDSNGYSFISPSAYVVFPTISAVDACGTLGSVHTSVTIGYAPGDLSTVEFRFSGFDASSVYKPFDFKDAQCPPTTLGPYDLISIIGQTKYNPIISPPEGLTTIDPAWAAACYAAAFQGNDPPFALKPESNLVPSPTSVAPLPTATPASPISNIPAIPKQTNLPRSSLVKLTTQTAMDPPKTNPSSPVVGDPTTPSQSTSIVAAYPASSSKSRKNLYDPSINIQTSATHLAPAIDPQSGNRPSDPILPATLATTLINAGANDPSRTSPAYITQIASGTPIASRTASEGSTINDPDFAPDPSSIIRSLTLEAGEAITVSGYRLSIDPSNSFLAVGSSTWFLQATPVAGSAALPLGTSWATAVLVSQPTAGSQISAPGKKVAETPPTTLLVFFPMNNGEGPSSIKPPSVTSTVTAITVNGQTYNGNVVSGFVGNGETLRPGQVITVSGTPISIPAAGASVLHSALTVLPMSADNRPTELASAGNLGSQQGASLVVIGSQTLTPGEVITVSGTPVSLAANPTEIVVGSSTQGLASYIINGFGGQNPTISTFKGRASRVRWDRTVLATSMIIGIWGVFGDTCIGCGG